MHILFSLTSNLANLFNWEQAAFFCEKWHLNSARLLHFRSYLHTRTLGETIVSMPHFSKLTIFVALTGVNKQTNATIIIWQKRNHFPRCMKYVLFVITNHGLWILFVRDTEKLFGGSCDMQLGEINSNQLPIWSFAISGHQLISSNQQQTESANDNEALAFQRIVCKLVGESFQLPRGAFQLPRGAFQLPGGAFQLPIAWRGISIAWRQRLYPPQIIWVCPDIWVFSVLHHRHCQTSESFSKSVNLNEERAVKQSRTVPKVEGSGLALQTSRFYHIESFTLDHSPKWWPNQTKPNTHFCRETGYVANTRFFGLVFTQILLR